ncbi:2-dehydro-3-deoxygalactonokinase [Chitinophaga sp. MM2321]|uniref:2-dehydro-3-deoxygalactonokinase n=1 Tax=Chitinophaga sp. MM2321 TaxID=3137178 RepID=UPI0032D599BB
MNNTFFISVDWGTSNFRLRLVEKSTLQVIEEIITADGAQSIFSIWQEKGGDREFIFLDFLKKKINQLKTQLSKEIEIVISGMASSSIGIRELPYAHLPFQINGKGLHVATIRHPLFPNGIKVISGVCGDSDIMRGEEVQLVGLANETGRHGKLIYTFPGTHCKHILCENGTITGFNTFMTGEVFNMLCKHTILKDSIDTSAASVMDLNSFDQGVLRSQTTSSLLEELFKIRAWDILGHKSAKENYFYLSGLLIGEEISTLKSKSFDQIFLCAGSNLYEFYKRAIQLSGLADKTTYLLKEIVETAVIRGQIKTIEQMDEY